MKKLFNVVFSIGFASYTLDWGIDIYIEPAKLFRKPKYWSNAWGCKEISVSILRIDIS